MMHLTVAICTFNRATSLLATIEQLARAAPPPDCSWDLVVVDNGSTDGTSAALRTVDPGVPLTVACEPCAGLSYARNRAVGAARGDYILWTDDDVLVGPDWLAAYARAIRRHPDSVFFGGPIRPVFQPPSPSWIIGGDRTILNVYAARDLGDRPLEFSAGTLPYGANYAIRADVQRRYPYDPRLGQQHARLGVGEETAVLQAVLSAGETGWWVPDARVRHVIPPERQRWSHVARYWRAVGRHAGGAVTPSAEPLLFGRPRWLWKAAIGAECRYRLRRLHNSKQATLPDLVAASVAWGKVLGCGELRAR